MTQISSSPWCDKKNYMIFYWNVFLLLDKSQTIMFHLSLFLCLFLTGDYWFGELQWCLVHYWTVPFYGWLPALAVYLTGPCHSLTVILSAHCVFSQIWFVKDKKWKLWITNVLHKGIVIWIELFSIFQMRL